ncbi:ChuT ABC-type hemin transport system, periplasmic component [actinobacterium SCGC AAA044-D11]
MKKFGVIAITALAILLTGCGISQKFHNHTISENDVTAISIDSTSDFSVSRVVVLANGVAEIMNALNAKSILVGRDISSTEKELKDIPIVTSGHQVMPEKVIELKPDLVIIDASTGPKAALDQIRNAGIKVVETPESWTLSDIPTKVSAVASAIGAPQQGDLLNQAFAKEIKTSTIATKPRIAFLYLRGTSSVYLIGGPGSGSDSLIEAIGATDVGAKSLPNPFNTMTAESLATLNPDVIIVMTKGLQSVGGISGLLKLPGVAQTQAGKNQAVIDVDDSLLLSYGPRTPSLVTALAKAVEVVTK